MECLSRPREGRGNSRKAKLQASVGSGLFGKRHKKKLGKRFAPEDSGNYWNLNKMRVKLFPYVPRQHLIHTCILNHT